MNQPQSTGSELGFLSDLDEGREQQFNTMGRAVVNALFVLLRSATMHDLANDALIRPTQFMVDALQSFRKTFREDVAVQLLDGTFFINRRLLKLDFGTYQNCHYLRRILEFLEINEVAFSQDIDGQGLHEFLQAFLRVARDHSGKIVDRPLQGVRLRQVKAQASAIGDEEAEPRQHVVNTYATGLLMLRVFVNDLRRGKSPRHAKVKRLCLDLIDVEARFHNLLLALLHLETYKGNLFSHMLNTAALSIVFGKRLGLTRAQLVDLGMAAFHHDLGRALVDIDEDDASRVVAIDLENALYTPRCTPEEMDALRVKVAQALVRIGGFNESVIQRMIVAFECQIPEDAPAVGLYYDDGPASFMTHVVRMASFYDEHTTPRADRPALTPDMAMRRILDDGGRTFDPFLGKLFANCLGAYPVGTLVELDSGEIGLVVNLPSNPIHFHRPQVKLLIDKVGRALGSAGPIVDLNETYLGGSKWIRTIERTLPSGTYGLSVTRFFFS
jgi:HD-GYP domain-containing protein (c-di-GMP phosphodiesterase class II)